MIVGVNCFGACAGLTHPTEVKGAKVEIASSGSDFFFVELHTCWFGAECG